MRAWLSRMGARLRAASHTRTVQRRAISDGLWQSTHTALPFLQAMGAEDEQRLRNLASLFLDRKEFSGAQGWVVTDAQAVMVAAQACLPILYIAPPDRPDLALRWYDGFVGIVLHAGEVRARRVDTDEAGVVHSWQEDLTGETVHGGPLMLAWSDVAAAGSTASEAYNVVIHEFVHVMDLQDGTPDGCPPMAAEARRTWLVLMQAQYEAFCEQVQQWERFGNLAVGPQGASRAQQAPLIDSYGTESIDEFFAVAAEAYFVRRSDFGVAYPELLALFDRFFIGGNRSVWRG
jgi:MtfA peptidase